MTECRDFKGIWIPAEIWLDKRLSAIDKVILFEIDSLTKDGTDCFASNEHLAEFSLCSERRVSEAVSKLIELGYVELVSYDGRKRFLRSRLAKSASQSSKICESDSQNLRDSNTNYKTNEYITTTSNDVVVMGEQQQKQQQRQQQTRFKIPSVEDVRAYCNERKNGINPQHFIDYYTSKGWMIGKNHMKDWKAAVRTWERNGYSTGQEKKEPVKERPEWAKRIKTV